MAEHGQVDLPPQGVGPITFGGPISDISGAQGIFGVLDEASTYSRPLTPAEVGDIFLASGKGKCPVEIAPFFTEAPGAREVSIENTLQLAPSVRGSAPLSYQWFLNQQPLIGQTNILLN